MYSWKERQLITEAYRKVCEGEAAKVEQQNNDESHTDNYKDTYKGISDGAKGIIDNSYGFGDSMSTKDGRDAFWNTLGDESGRRLSAVGKGLKKALWDDGYGGAAKGIGGIASNSSGLLDSMKTKEGRDAAMKTFSEEMSNSAPVKMVKGIYNAVRHPIDTINVLRTNPSAILPFSGLYSEEGAENYDGSQFLGDGMALLGAKGLQKGVTNVGKAVKNVRGYRAAKNIGKLENAAEKAAQAQANAGKKLMASTQSGDKFILKGPNERAAYFNGTKGNAFQGQTYSVGANGQRVFTPEWNAYNSGMEHAAAAKNYANAAAKSSASNELVNNARNVAWDKGFVAPGESGLEAADRLLNQASDNALKAQVSAYGGQTANAIASDLKK